MARASGGAKNAFTNLGRGGGGVTNGKDPSILSNIIQPLSYDPSIRIN